MLVAARRAACAALPPPYRPLLARARLARARLAGARCRRLAGGVHRLRRHHSRKSLITAAAFLIASAMTPR